MSRSFVVACLLIAACAPALAAGLEVAAACPETAQREADDESAAAAAAPAATTGDTTATAAATASGPSRVSHRFDAARRARWHSLLPGMYK